MATRCVLRQQLGDGVLEVWDDGRRRSLWFDDVILQTEIDRGDPTGLPNPANRAMLGHLLFAAPPRRVLLGGCGGGGIARWFHAHAPDIRGDAVEISPAVAQIAREWFDFPGPDSGWQLHVRDMRDHLWDAPQPYDFILFDLEEGQRSPDWLTAPEFLALCRQRLATAGVLTLNLITDDPDCVAAALWNVRQAFTRNVACLPVPGHHNIMVMAFASTPHLDNLEGRARAAEARWGIEFPVFLRRLRRANPPGSGLF